MGNLRREHASNRKGMNRKKPVKKEEDKMRVKEEDVAGDQAVAVDAGKQDEETKKMSTVVVLQCEDGVELVVPKEEASLYGGDIESKIRSGHYHDAYVQTRSSCNKDYPLIRLYVKSDVLSKVIHYSNEQASDPAGWDAAGFVRDLDHVTLVDMILAAQELENRGLLGHACRAVNDMIADKAPCQIRAMFGIRPYSEAATAGPYFGRRAVKTIMPDDHNTEEEERALRALHIVRCQEFVAYDPISRDYLCTRFSCYNIAFFDHDKEYRFGRGPPLRTMCESSIVSSSVNFISLKVRKSDVGFPINMFGTIIARDTIDYRCVYLFRREVDDSQIITSPDDTLTLIDPHRGLVPADIIFFEINLKIKCGDGTIKDFSKGLTDFNICSVYYDWQTSTADLMSCLSSVELEFAHVSRPLEASITINTLNGPSELTRVAAWTTGNTEACIILYDSEATAGRPQMKTNVYSVSLARRVVLVPLGEKLVLHLLGDDEDEHLVLTLGHCDEEDEHVCMMGSSELQVKVSWTAIPARKSHGWREIVGNVWLLT